MAACVVHDSNGQPISISSTTPAALRPGLTAAAITDAEFDALVVGSSRWDAATRRVLVDTVKITAAANEATLTTEADNSLAGLRLIANSTGTMTAAQLSNAARLIARAVIVLARLVVRRLDATD